MSPAKVCLVTGNLGLGGAEKQLVLLAQGLHRCGIRTCVLVMNHGGPYETVLRESGVPVVYLGFKRLHGIGVDVARNLVAFCRLVSFLRKEAPDVVHAFLYHEYVTVAPAARLAGVPVVVAGRRSMGTFKENRKVLLAVERAATRITDMVIANARAVADNCLRQEGLDPRKITVILNGLPQETFDHVEPAVADTHLPVIVCVANLRYPKGHEHLLEAMALLDERGVACTLLLVGDGKDRPALEERACCLSVDIRFLGVRTDVPALLRRADVVVSPSLAEGLSNSVMEAMAAAVPVVATAVGGTPELLDGRGVVVPAGDPAALADALAATLADLEHARDLAAEAAAWARCHLSVDTMVDSHVGIYRDLLARRRA
ncbi:glycosyltransferase [Nonomuraea sp. 3N208]|uniref:glycosyltransferase n=1 Tax=Nonomuraea sp. 3N208 TaxID=3457421 RepID=UPI003FD1B4F2